MQIIQAAQYAQSDSHQRHTPPFFGDSRRSEPKEDTTVKAGATNPEKQQPFQVRAEDPGFSSEGEKAWLSTNYRANDTSYPLPYSVRCTFNPLSE